MLALMMIMMIYLYSTCRSLLSLDLN